MDLLAASIKESIWHKMRQDLKVYLPDIGSVYCLMCCLCGRRLPYKDFSLEHIIPQQALADDPKEIKSHADTTVNARSGNILLCNKRLLIKDRIYHNGCNGWKGRFYDGPLRELLNGRILEHKYKRPSDQHIIAALCASYLAMVLEFGYQVALTPSGVLIRQQFFLPHKFHRHMPLRHRIILSAPPPKYDESHFRIWSHPFNFTIERNACFVGFRTMSLIVPLSRDPRLPIARSVLIVPSRYTLRPDFRTGFN
jgi:hypothetical protein